AEELNNWLKLWASLADTRRTTNQLLLREYSYAKFGWRIPHFGVSKWASIIQGEDATARFKLEDSYLSKLSDILNKFASTPGSTVQEKVETLLQTREGKEVVAYLLSQGFLSRDYTEITVPKGVLTEFDSRDEYSEGTVDKIANYDRIQTLLSMLAGGKFLSVLAPLRLGAFSNYVASGALFHIAINTFDSAGESILDGTNFFEALKKKDWSFSAFGSSYAFLGISQVGGAGKAWLSTALKQSVLARMIGKTGITIFEGAAFTGTSYALHGIPPDEVGTHAINSMIDMFIFSALHAKPSNPRLEYRAGLTSKTKAELEAEVGRLRGEGELISYRWADGRLSTRAAERQAQENSQRLADALEILAGRYAREARLTTTSPEARAESLTRMRELERLLIEARESELSLGMRSLDPSSPDYAFQRARLENLRAQTAFTRNPSRENFDTLMSARAKLIEESRTALDRMLRSGEVNEGQYQYLRNKLLEQERVNEALTRLAPIMIDGFSGRGVSRDIASAEDIIEGWDLPEEVKAATIEDVRLLRQLLERAEEIERAPPTTRPVPERERMPTADELETLKAQLDAARSAANALTRARGSEA
ncbi:MAG: hypothetical protein MN733_36525, partial [Nitrososphaera sp.]|nr:hypothetical protein [Nitrososphaera sp.]